MFFIGDSNIEFKRGKDKMKRKSRVGTSGIPLGLTGAALGTGIGLYNAAKYGTKSKLPALVGGAIGGFGGYRIGKTIIDKKMKIGDYES